MNMTLGSSLMARATLIGFLDVVRPHAESTSPQRRSSGRNPWTSMPSLVNAAPTASIEFGSILHDTNTADGIRPERPVPAAHIGFKGPVQILLHLGATFRRVLLAAIASACVDHQKDSIRISPGQPGDRRLRNAACLLTSSLLQISRHV